MAADNPPRFVPTLTETANDLTSSTVVEDTAYFEQRGPVDSMLDLDLSVLESPVSRIEQASPLGAYQGNRVVNPQAVNHDPVAHWSSSVARPVAAPPGVPVRPVAPAAAAVPHKPASLQSMLPGDWNNQLRAAVQQAVRQELQQQMPFLLLQWSKQIEDKLTPHIHQQLVKMVQEWQQASSK